MTTNDSKLLEKVLSKWAIHQYNPETKISDFKDWDNLRRVYVKRTGWNIYLADISNVAKIAIDLARLAALDDCKTLLDDRLKEGLWDEIRGLAKARELILAEIEALRKKVEA